MDLNDNPPVFLPFPRTTSVREDTTPQSMILAVGATDADDGLNGVVSYDIVLGDIDGMPCTCYS